MSRQPIELAQHRKRPRASMQQMVLVSCRADCEPQADAQQLWGTHKWLLGSWLLPACTNPTFQAVHTGFADQTLGHMPLTKQGQLVHGPHPLAKEALLDHVPVAEAVLYSPHVLHAGQLGLPPDL